MVTQIILHIGLHHTGTTSFQLFLNNHCAELQDQGVLVYEPLNNGINGAELSPAANLQRGADHYDRVKRNIQAQCKSDAGKLIVSAESLWLLNTELDIRRLRSLFPPNIEHFKIIIVLRDEAEWARRHLGTNDQVEIDRDKVRLTWVRSIDGYRAVFGDVEVLTYERSGMVERLSESCGIEVTGLKVDYHYHKTTWLKQLLTRKFPGFLRFYSRHLAHSVLGKAKRKFFNQ